MSTRQHERNRVSVGNAASLFGGGEDDFFNNLSSEQAPPQANGNPSWPNSHQNQGIGTVLEEDEPESPQVGSVRSDGRFSQQHDWPRSQSSHSHRRSSGASQRQQAHAQQPYQSYAPVEQHPYPNQYDQAQQHYTQDRYENQSTTSYESLSTHEQQQQAYPDIPYYPGYVYDPASNSYVADPNPQPEWTPQPNDAYDQQATQEDTGDWDQNQGYGDVQYGQPGTYEQQEYVAQDNYQDQNYGGDAQEYQQQQPVSQEMPKESWEQDTAESYQYSEPARNSTENHDPYANSYQASDAASQAYSQSEHDYDQYSQQEDPYQQQQYSQPDYGYSNDNYDAQPDPYSQEQYQQPVASPSPPPPAAAVLPPPRSNFAPPRSNAAPPAKAAAYQADQYQQQQPASPSPPPPAAAVLPPPRSNFAPPPRSAPVAAKPAPIAYEANQYQQQATSPSPPPPATAVLPPPRSNFAPPPRSTAAATAPPRTVNPPYQPDQRQQQEQHQYQQQQARSPSPPSPAIAVAPPPRSNMAPPPRAAAPPSRARPTPIHIPSLAAQTAYAPASPSKLVAMARYDSSDTSTPSMTPQQVSPRVEVEQAQFVAPAPDREVERYESNGYRDDSSRDFEDEDAGYEQQDWGEDEMVEHERPTDRMRTASWDVSDSEVRTFTSAMTPEPEATTPMAEEPKFIPPPPRSVVNRPPPAAAIPAAKPPTPVVAEVPRFAPPTRTAPPRAIINRPPPVSTTPIKSPPPPSAPTPVESITEKLANTAIVESPAVQLRRRSFGRHQGKGTPSPVSSPPQVRAGRSLSTDFGAPAPGSTLAKPAFARVPEVSVEAPSPEMRIEEEEEDIEGDWGLNDDALDEEEEEEEQVEVALVQAARPVVEVQPRPNQDPYPSTNYSQPSAYAPAPEPEYGFDDSQVFGEDNALDSGNSQGSGYGDWAGDSAAGEGYDSAAPAQETTLYHPPATTNQYTAPYDAYAPTVSPATKPPSSATPPSLPPPPLVLVAAPSPSAPDRNTFSPTRQYSESTPLSPPRKLSKTPTYGSPKRGAPPLALPPMPRSMNPPSNDPYASYDAPRPAPPIRSGTSPAYASYSTTDSYAARPNGAPPMSPYNENSQYALRSPVDRPPIRRGATASPAITKAAPYDPYANQTLARPVLNRAPSSFSKFDGPPPDLGLARSPAPVVTFGFGGRMVVVFPNSARSGYGMDNGLYGAPVSLDTTPSTPSTVHIRKLADIIPVAESTTFPGPIFMDGGKANAAKKRKESIVWLEQRIGELEQESTYTSGSRQNPERTRMLETRLILIRLVKVMVEHDGKLTGTPKLDEVVRSILVPEFAAASEATDAEFPLASELGFATPVTPMGTGSDAPVAMYSVSSSNLDKISSFLLRGERRTAVKYALDHKMWAHAFVISSCVDTDCYKDVVSEFLRSELAPAPNGPADLDGREGLRVAYSMFAGLGADSVQQFMPPRHFAQTQLALPTPRLLGPSSIPRANTPISPNFPGATTPLKLPGNVLAKWLETAAMIVANRTAGDSAALTALGDTLASNGWIDAAHICYLLSPATSPIGGVGSQSARLVLIGGAPPTNWSTAGIELESIMLTELVEFALSLAPAVKGQEPFAGFPHLQAFRLYHAGHLADAGQVSQAQKYTEAVVGTLKLATKPSPFYHAGLVAQVKLLSDRLAAAPGHDKAGSWITRNVPRPTIDSLWSTLEGRFTKFVSGEAEAQALAPKPEVLKASPASIGPFSHYSAISPASTSGTLSRQPSQTELAPVSTPIPRPKSAAAQPPPVVVAAAAGPPPVKRAPFKTHHSRSSSLGFVGYDYDPSAPPPWQAYAPAAVSSAPLTPIEPIKPAPSDYSNSGSPYSTPAPYGTPVEYKSSYDAPPPARANEEEIKYDNEEGGNAAEEGGWGGSSWQNGEEETQSAAVRAPMFSAPSENFAEDESGFISPMAAFTPNPSPGPPNSFVPQNAQVHKRTSTRDELDDLGIGNSRSRKPGFDAIDEAGGEGDDGAAPAAAKKVEERPPIKQTKSFFGGWFKREPAAAQPVGPGPVRANLGEQTSFVFDPELKRWVNKKTGGDTGAPLATGPPPRAATASPTRAARSQMANPRFASATPPPFDASKLPARPSIGQGPPPPSLNRSRTAGDLQGQNRLDQARSVSAGPPPPMPGRSMTSPPPISGASTPVGGVRKKPLKSRYVVTPI